MPFSPMSEALATVTVALMSDGSGSSSSTMTPSSEPPPQAARRTARDTASSGYFRVLIALLGWRGKRRRLGKRKSHLRRRTPHLAVALGPQPHAGGTYAPSRGRVAFSMRHAHAA